MSTPAPPVKKVEDGGQRRGDDPERSFQWYTPKKRRATLYEDVTIDSQPSVHRHLNRGWPMYFEDGRGIWWDDSTKLRSTDWYDFRDPGQVWERNFYQQGTAYEHLIEGAVRTARRERVFDDFTPEWVDFLRANLQVPAFIEHGLWLATASAARDCLSDTIAHCVALRGGDEAAPGPGLPALRHGPRDALRRLPGGGRQEELPRGRALAACPAYVEKLCSTPDWGER